ncbi:GtrA family protein [Agarivorans aestuarii]|uniref:GtrA family protein n=1 Tax=Agarivorans aestuarii TaxID=1563703 RepID=UPI001FEC9E16|nr:GtrA family protein [Agarivorans aestuarii]
MAKLINRLLALRIVRYGLAGGVATLIHFSLALIILELWPLAFIVANLVGFSLAFIFSYLVQTLWVFEKELAINNALRFFVVQLGALSLSVWLSSQLTTYPNFLKVSLVIALLPAITFVIHRFWTFARAEAS